MKHCLPLWLLLVLLMYLPGSARATAGPPATGRPLAEALNPDGTLRAGAAGSFDARQFRMGIAPDGRPVFRPAGALGAGDERWQDGFGVPNGTDAPVQTVVQSGSTMYIGGYFTTVGRVPANGVAKWNGTTWSALGTGVRSDEFHGVRALAVAANGDVFAGGEFAEAGGLPANNIAKWNGTSWSSLGTGASNGVNDPIYTLGIAANGDVYVGGAFAQAGGITANRVARWNGTSWNSLGTGASNGVVGYVYTLVVAGSGEVYCGGYFSQAGGAPANSVAKWNGSAWSTLGNGVTGSGYVHTLALASNGEVYAGGFFSQAGSVAANNVAKWNGNAWSALGAGPVTGASTGVYALTIAGTGDVYAAGFINQPGGLVTSYVSRWDGAAWSPLGPGATDTRTRAVATLALAVTSNGDVYAVGPFTQVGGISANYLARWNGSAWTTVATSPSNGLYVDFDAYSNSSVYALAVAGNGDVYVGGGFFQAGGLKANNVARWNGTTWSTLGTGTTNGVTGGQVRALAVSANGNVYVGGDFTQAGGIAAGSVARWNGTAWNSLGTGANGLVSALAVAANGDIYMGGSFGQVSGVAANNVARWNGTAWSALGTGSANGIDGMVKALAVGSNGMLYAGGNFGQAGSVAANCIAKWDGTAWSSLGTGASGGLSYGQVFSLAVAGNGEVYAGGDFYFAGGTLVNSVAKWNGTAWSALDTGIPNGIVNALAVAGNGDVYAGGTITQAGTVVTNAVAKWNGTAWSALGTGLNGRVYGLASGPTGKLLAAGRFTATGDGSKAQVHFAIYDPAAPLATAAARATPVAQLFPNPAHGTATLRLPATAARQPLTLTDALGRLVRQYPAPTGPEAVLDLRGLPAGVYLVRCGQLSQRLVVE